MRVRVHIGFIKRGERRSCRSSRLAVPIWVVVLCQLFSSGCGGEKVDKEEYKNILLATRDTVLTLEDVVSRIPVGLEPTDSIALFRSITDNWVKTAVLSDLAKNKLPDTDDIDRKVEAYRNHLIVAAYLREMKKRKEIDVEEDSIRAFYERHRHILMTERPLVKGIYLKVASDSEGLDEIKRLVFCGEDDCIDRLEKNWTGNVAQYDYFMGNWVDWQMIADMIPYRFYDPDAFLKSTVNFETSYNGSTYLLHISEYLPSGSEQPYEFASSRIAELIRSSLLARYESALVESLVRKAIDNGSLEARGYDPLNHLVIHEESRQSAGGEIKSD